AMSRRSGFDLAQLVVGVFKEEMLGAIADAHHDPDAEREHEHDFREKNQNAPVAMLRRLVRADANVEQMLLAPLPRVRDTLVPQALALILRFHFVARLFADSSMIRWQ